MTTESTPIHDMLTLLASHIDKQKEGSAPIYSMHFNNNDLEFLLTSFLEKKKNKTVVNAEFLNFFDVAGYVVDERKLKDKETCGVLLGVDVVANNSVRPNRVELRFMQGSTKGTLTIDIPMPAIRNVATKH